MIHRGTESMAHSNQNPSRLVPQSANWPDRLSHPQTGEYGISITRCRQYGLVNLRCAPEDIQPVGDVFGPALPVAANHFSRAGERLAVWLGPDETLLMLADTDEAEFSQKATSHMTGRRFALTTLSDGFAIFTLEGSNVRTMLAKGISVDLHPDSFIAGQCIQTILSGVAVTCLCLSQDRIMIICRTSFADFTESWLKDASTEYGYQISG